MAPPPQAEARGDFAGFADALYRFGHAAGQCFKSRQAGVYATDELAAVVARFARVNRMTVAA